MAYISEHIQDSLSIKEFNLMDSFDKISESISKVESQEKVPEYINLGILFIGYAYTLEFDTFERLNEDDILQCGKSLEKLLDIVYDIEIEKSSISKIEIPKELSKFFSVKGLVNITDTIRNYNRRDSLRYRSNKKRKIMF